MADWTAARLDVSPDTARTLITTARSLEDAPDLETGLEAGTVSFDRTVELARARTAGV
ncbi:MAG: hypothetical protein GWN71_37085, partial [Gammaproteobacteria bacterium]|nr:hypothetical protein [Gemmatimonadota bacterium]NIU78966.1 hypothetical protein [Gammaproteobacteria bacterium]NIY07324.1 hypothetical protein [Gemmatimonadota bacterium]